MQTSFESDGSEEYFDAEDSTPHRFVKYVVVSMPKTFSSNKIIDQFNIVFLILKF